MPTKPILLLHLDYREVFVIDVLHSEIIPLFWQIKYIFNIHHVDPWW